MNGMLYTDAPRFAQMAYDVFVEVQCAVAVAPDGSRLQHALIDSEERFIMTSAAWEKARQLDQLQASLWQAEAVKRICRANMTGGVS